MIDIVELKDLLGRRDALGAETFAVAGDILAAVRERGEAAVREYAARFDGLDAGAPLVLDRARLEAAWDGLPGGQQGVLQRTAARIRTFAAAQLGQLAGDLDTTACGYRVGHRCVPVDRAGCYAPGGRYPLPSSVLMTAVTAAVAGVPSVVVASPRPGPVTLAAAHVAGAEGVLQVGGAQAIAALTYGAGVGACDAIVGPGNRFVTAAKHLASRDVRIDMLAGPSELVVVADDLADADCVAADLLAQAEHDPDARPILVALGGEIAARVQAAVGRQLMDLPTAETAAQALRAGGIVVVDTEAAAAAACDALAPEHLAVHLEAAEEFAARVRHFGAVFLGRGAAEVLGDYGLGPNHVLPTGGAARSRGGLSVLDFLRVRTFIAGGDDGPERTQLLADVQALAEMEGLAGHARSARLRVTE